MNTRTAILGCHPPNAPATMQAMSVTPVIDSIRMALDHAIETDMEADLGWMCVPEIHVSKVTWKILEDEFMLGAGSPWPPKKPTEEGVLGYFKGYSIKAMKYGQGWTIIYRETRTTDRKRMN